MEEGDSLVRLQPCPFCGGEAQLRTSGGGSVYVHCVVCFAASNVVSNKTKGAKRKVTEAWNRRVGGSLLRVMDVTSAVETLWKAARDPIVPQAKILEAAREILRQSEVTLQVGKEVER
jgi:Restriction alleviation protein Lar